jgi:hypothetical protein
MKFHEEIEHLIDLLKKEKNKDPEVLNQLENLLEEFARNYQYRNYSNEK